MSRLTIKRGELGEKALQKISISFVLIISIFIVEEHTNIPHEEIVWGALMFLIFSMFYYSVKVELSEQNRVIRAKEEFTDRIFRKIPYPTSVFFVDTDCKIRYANDEVAKIRGFMSRDEIIGKTPEEILGVKRSIIRDVLDTGQVIINQRRSPITDHEGKKRSHLISCFQIKDTDEKLLGALEVLTDITELEKENGRDSM
ncbi:MAG: PAS domain-containing protein [Methanophagales archaeon]|nr:PAS domain-containing protein [Methanophagales archaeon]